MSSRFKFLIHYLSAGARGKVLSSLHVIQGCLQETYQVIFWDRTHKARHQEILLLVIFSDDVTIEHVQ